MPKNKKAGQLETEDINIVVVKCGLNKLLRAPFRDKLEDLLLYCNQLRVLMSLVVKQHLLSLLGTLPENIDLPFTVDQPYISRVFSVLKDVDRKTRQGKNDYLPSLIAAKETVLAQLPLPSYIGPFKKTALGQIFSYMAQFYFTNLKTHLDEHCYDAIYNWYNNIARINLSLEQFNNRKKQKSFISALEKQWKENNHDNYQTKLALETQLNQLKGTNQKLKFMFGLAKQVQELQRQSNRPLKLFSVVPEAKIRISPLQFDDRVLENIVKSITGLPVKLLNRDEIWDSFINLQKVKKLKPNKNFNYSCSTDGVTINLHFAQTVPKSAADIEYHEACKRRKLEETAHPELKFPKIKKPKIEPPKLALTANLPPGEYDEDQMTSIPAEMLNYIGVDPGVRSVLSVVTLQDADLNTSYMLRQNDYQYRSWNMWSKEQHKKRVNAQHLTEKFTMFNQTIPSKKNILLEQLAEYRQILSTYWTDLWKFYKGKRYRKNRFIVYRKRESFMEKEMTKMINIFGPSPIILFGDAGQNGGFGKIKSKGAKGPVVELRKRLARKAPVILCSEFRTSKCCGHCGRILKHPFDALGHEIKGQSHCEQQAHSTLYNRDKLAARNIAGRFVTSQLKRYLGPWKGSDILILDDPTNPRGAENVATECSLFTYL